MTTKPRRRTAPIKVSTSGSPLGNLHGLAALLVKLDRQPPLRLVSPTPAEPRPDASDPRS